SSGKSNTLWEVGVHIIGEINIAFPSIVQGDKEIVSIDDFSQFLMDFQIKLIQRLRIDRPTGNTMVEALGFLRSVFVGKVMKDTPESGGFSVVITTVYTT